VSVGILAFTAGPPAAEAWNEVAYRLAVEKAVDALPKPLKEHYKQVRAGLLERIRGLTVSGANLHFDVDRLESFPFRSIPEERSAAVARYGEEKIREAGDLPWQVIEVYGKLVQAFRASDLTAIEALSAELALYVGALHAPAAVSSGGDGEAIQQQGFRERFASRLPELYGDKMKVSASTAFYLDRPSEYVFSIVRDSYVWVDNLLYLDALSREGVTSYDRYYYEGLWLRAGGILNERLSRAAENIASYWYTAWASAGKPEILRPAKTGR
jgi:hypothetical protein